MVLWENWCRHGLSLENDAQAASLGGTGCRAGTMLTDASRDQEPFCRAAAPDLWATTLRLTVCRRAGATGWAERGDLIRRR